jgi:formylglycine-generating enzyme required for sulfatase activity
VPDQVCLRWLEVPGQEPQRSCAEFAKPTPCKGAKQHMRYCIDRYEYTPKGWSLPLVNVSWGEAQNICGAMDKRLCREEEWEFACEGPEALPYPYGYVRDGAACNHDLDDLFDPRQKLRDRRVPPESLPRCKSPFGVFNLVGNVDEWTTRESRDPPWRSILRGGWWLTGRNRCRAATESHSEIYAGSQTSFRCCKAARK